MVGTSMGLARPALSDLERGFERCPSSCHSFTIRSKMEYAKIEFDRWSCTVEERNVPNDRLDSTLY